VWRLCQRNGHIFAFDRVANAAGLHSIQGNAHEGDRISVSLWGILDWIFFSKKMVRGNGFFLVEVQDGAPEAYYFRGFIPSYAYLQPWFSETSNQKRHEKHGHAWMSREDNEWFVSGL